MLLDEDPATVLAQLPYLSRSWLTSPADPPHNWQFQHPSRQNGHLSHRRLSLHSPPSARPPHPRGRIGSQEYYSIFEQFSGFRLTAQTELTRTHTSLSSHHAETVSTHSSTTHASTIVELDTQKFRIAKSASDLEIEGEKLEADLEGLRGRLQELEMQGVEGDEYERGRREGEDPVV